MAVRKTKEDTDENINPSAESEDIEIEGIDTENVEEKYIRPDDRAEDEEEIQVPDTGEDEATEIEEQEDALLSEPDTELSEAEAPAGEKPIENDKAAPKKRAARKPRVVGIGKKHRSKTYNFDTYFDPDKGEKAVINRSNSKAYREYLELAASANTAKVLTGTLESSDITEHGDVIARVNYGENFIVTIPVERFCDFSLQPPEVLRDIQSGTQELRNYRLQTMLKNRYGSKVNFIVRYVEEASRTCLGDQISAMSRMARQTFVSHNNRQPWVVPGGNLKMRVVQANRVGVWLEGGGAECFVPTREVDWLRRADVSERYSAGDEVVVQVIAIKPKKIDQGGRITNIIEIDASIKRLQEDPNKIYFDKYQVGTSGAAKVTQVTDRGVFVIFANKISVFCNFNNGDEDNPMPGDIINVTIDRKFDENYTFRGKIGRTLRKGISA